MGEVYSAGDPELGRKVAIKFLSPEMAASRPAVEQLIREAKAASALNHPHIITVYEVIRAEDDVAIAMELVEGRALRKFCGKPAEIAPGDPLGAPDRAGARGRASAQYRSSRCEAGESDGAR